MSDSVVKPLKTIYYSDLSRKNTQQDFSKTFLRSDHLSNKPIWERLNALNCVIVFGIPLIALYGLCTINAFVWQTWVFAIVVYFWSGLGITAGYHRLWSHCAYRANGLFEFFLMLGGTSSLQGSIKWWCLLHRAHHRWTDTDLDPYNARRGFFYAHVGWLLLDNIRVSGHIDIEDLRSSRLIRWQHSNYAWFGPFMSLVFPTIFCWYFFNDIRGGFYIAGALRLLCIHHATWCINSVAHFYGSVTFDDTISPRDSIITGLITMGEGYHNFHHEFPNDYRNGIHWYDYDPTKWLIWTMSKMGGAAWDLRMFPYNEIIKGEVAMVQKQIDAKKEGIDYGVPIETLPLWTQTEFQEECRANKRRVLILINGIIYDVTDFLKRGAHPGGKRIIVARKGKDASDDFNGDVYNHTNAARNLMSHMRVAKFVDENVHVDGDDK